MRAISRGCLRPMSLRRRLGVGVVEPSWQAGVFRSRLFENWNICVAILPQLEQILVGALRLRGVAGEGARSRQLEARHRIHRIDQHDASMVENPLELGGSFGGLTGREIRLTANVDGVSLPKFPMIPMPPMPRSKREAACSVSIAATPSFAFNENSTRPSRRFR